MNETFGLADLYSTLLYLEKTGNEIYRSLADRANNERDRKLFRFLADQEMEHYRLYSAMKENYTSVVDIDEEYREYLQALIANTFHLLDTVRGSDLPDPIGVGLQLEKDTLVFLGELGQLVGDYHREELTAIKQQERRHLTMLATFRKGESLQRENQDA